MIKKWIIKNNKEHQKTIKLINPLCSNKPNPIFIEKFFNSKYSKFLPIINAPSISLVSSQEGSMAVKRMVMGEGEDIVDCFVDDETGCGFVPIVMVD
jgi:hypothetical protein